VIAVLYARSDSFYKSLPGCDVWDIDRDARLWPGGCPVVAHPPCRAWGRLRSFSKPRADEKQLAIHALAMVRIFGGVLEHPAGSTLWSVAGLPRPGFFDEFGGWTLPVNQVWWGHRAEKRTWLYIVGAGMLDLPQIPFFMGYPSCPVERMGKAERERTTPAFSQWLVDLAVRCSFSVEDRSS